MPACSHRVYSVRKPCVHLLSPVIHSSPTSSLFQVLYAIRVRSSFSASQDLLPFIASAVCVFVLTACALVANKLQPGTRAMQALAAFAVVCAALPMLVHWGSRGESGGGLQIIMPLRMIVFLMAVNLDWVPGTVCLVAGAFVAAVAVALTCACVDGSMLVLSACIVCAAVLVERWCWCAARFIFVYLCSYRPLLCISQRICTL